MQPGRIISRVYEPFSGGKLYDQALLVIWLLVIALPLGIMTPFRYLFILYFLSFFLFDTRNVMTGVVKAWWLWPFQIIALLSMFWSPYASEALRGSLLMILSTVVVVVVASRFTPTQIVRCMLIACTVILLFILTRNATIEQGAGFGSKNYAAQFMLNGFIVAAAAALNPKEFTHFRWFGLAMMAPFVYLVVAAQSTTALLMLIASAGLVFGMRVFFLDSRKIQHLSSLLVVLGLMTAMIIIYAVLIFVDQHLIDSFLGAFGKDATFTGRTAMWEEAGNQIGMRPYLGVGLEGFWQDDVGSAQTLNINDHKPLGTKLTFHNVHLEVMVHLGIIGYAAFVLSMAAVIWMALKRLFTRADMPVIAFCAIIAVSLMSSMVESSLWSGFNFQAFLFFACGAVYARGDRRRHVGNMVVREQDFAAAVRA
ncbi:MAG: O-antigen ligase family protein [Henriciella sp.]|nr:O-antigen ligase family protein [Henriciella sp.]